MTQQPNLVPETNLHLIRELIQQIEEIDAYIASEREQYGSHANDLMLKVERSRKATLQNKLDDIARGVDIYRLIHPYGF